VRAGVAKGVTLKLALRSCRDGREGVLGVERRRRWSKAEKARIVEETLMPGAVVCEVARRYGVAQSLLFTWRRQARTAEPNERDGSRADIFPRVPCLPDLLAGASQRRFFLASSAAGQEEPKL
jgi:transposase-like protein